MFRRNISCPVIVTRTTFCCRYRLQDNDNPARWEARQVAAVVSDADHFMAMLHWIFLNTVMKTCIVVMEV